MNPKTMHAIRQAGMIIGFECSIIVFAGLLAGLLAGCGSTEPATVAATTTNRVAAAKNVGATNDISATSGITEASTLLKAVLANPSGAVQGIICDVPTPLPVLAIRPTASASPQPLLITVSKSSDKVVATEGKEGTLLDITSAGGIGEATIIWQQDPPPTITLRLNLAGLEGLIVEGIYVGATASVSSSPPYSVTETVRGAGQEDRLPLTPDDRYWIDVTWTSNHAGGEPEIPIKDGYFEAKLPPTLLAENNGSISIRWIDFFR